MVVGLALNYSLNILVFWKVKQTWLGFACHMTSTECWSTWALTLKFLIFHLVWGLFHCSFEFCFTTLLKLASGGLQRFSAYSRKPFWGVERYVNKQFKSIFFLECYWYGSLIKWEVSSLVHKITHLLIPLCSL